MHASYPRLALKRMDERSRLAAERIVELKARREQLQFDIQTRPKRVSVGSESSHFGKISEQILPAFATFPYKHRDCRIMLMPVDYVVFSGLHAKNLVESIIFVDVKTGAGRLSPDQKQISHNIVAGKLEHTVIGK
jgi:predicted Holliday junction resolvase-like endonuclease